MRTDIPSVSHVFERAAALTDPDRADDGRGGGLAGHQHRSPDDQEHVLREGARLAYHGDPPAAVAAWLAELGIDAG